LIDINNSEPWNLLTQRGFATRPFKNEKEGLQAMVDGEIDAVFHNEIILKYFSKSDFPGRIHVLPEISDQYYVSFAFPHGSALRERFNRILIKIMDSDDYPHFKERYMGPGE
jgi:ABC-type amino acid transport substrate-binding protein